MKLKDILGFLSIHTKLVLKSNIDESIVWVGYNCNVPQWAGECNFVLIYPVNGILYIRISPDLTEKL